MQIVTRYQAINGKEFQTADAALTEDFRILRDDLTRWLSMMSPSIMARAKGWEELRKRFGALRRKYDEYEALLKAEEATKQPRYVEPAPIPRDEYADRGTERHRMTAAAPADTAQPIEEAQAA